MPPKQPKAPAGQTARQVDDRIANIIAQGGLNTVQHVRPSLLGWSGRNVREMAVALLACAMLGKRLVRAPRTAHARATHCSR